jgi:hypothetical protein
VKRLVYLSLVACLTTTFTACGNVFVRGALPGGPSTVSGSVSVVQLSAAIGENGTTVQITLVTLYKAGHHLRSGFVVISAAISPCSKPSAPNSIRDELAPASSRS